MHVVSLIAAGVTGLTVFARAELVRPRVRSSYVTNPVVRLLMDAVAVASVFVVAEVWDGWRAPFGVALFFVLCAITSSAMLASMFVHDGRVTVAEVADAAKGETRADDAAIVRAEVEKIPEVIDKSLPPVLKALAEAPDPYQPKT